MRKTAWSSASEDFPSLHERMRVIRGVLAGTTRRGASGDTAAGFDRPALGEEFEVWVTALLLVPKYLSRLEGLELSSLGICRVKQRE